MYISVCMYVDYSTTILLTEKYTLWVDSYRPLLLKLLKGHYIADIILYKSAEVKCQMIIKQML